MKKIISYIWITVSVVMLTSCVPRDPRLEGAIIDLNAGRIDRAFNLAISVTESDPDNIEAWFILGKIYGIKEMYPEMVDAFDRSIALGDSFKAEITRIRSEHFQSVYNSAVYAYNTYINAVDKTDNKSKTILLKAINKFKSASLLDPAFYDSFKLIASGQMFLDNKQEAESSYKKLIMLFPDTIASWIDYSRFLYKDKQYDSACIYLEKADKCWPYDPNILTTLSQCYDFSNQRKKAIETYKKAFAVIPDEKAISFNLGLIYIKMAGDSTLSDVTIEDNLLEAITWFDKALNIDNQLKDAYKLKSSAEIRLKRWENAIKTLLEGLEQFPDDYAMWDNLGICYVHTNQEEKAGEAFKKAEKDSLRDVRDGVEPGHLR